MNKNMKTTRIIKGSIVFCLGAVAAFTSYAAENIFNDGFDDGDRTANPAWYLVKAESSATVVSDAIIGSGNAMQFNNEHSGSNPTTAPFAQKGVVAYLDNAGTNTVSLLPYESLTLSFDFRLQAVIEQSGQFRFGLSHDGGTPFTADGTANGSSNGDDDYSYFVGMSSGTGSSTVAIREDNGTSSGYMAGSDLVSDKGTGSFSLNDTNAHSVAFTIYKTAVGTREFTLSVDGSVVATGNDPFNVKSDFNGVGFVSTHRDLDFIVDNVAVTYSNLQYTASGTPHYWLDNYDLVVSNDYEAADLADSDTDTMLNWEEHRCGTNPTNAASLLVVSNVTAIATNQYEVTWQSVPGKSYNLLNKTDLSTAGWTTNVASVAASAGSGTTTTSTVSSASAFFEIELDY